MKNYQKYFFLLVTFLLIQKFTYAQSTDLGFSCGEGGFSTEIVDDVLILIQEKNYQAIRNLLTSEKPVEKFLAIVILKQLSKEKKVKLTKEELEVIKIIRKSKEKVSVCSGCTYWDIVELKTLLRNRPKHRMKEDAEIWVEFHLSQTNKK